MGGWGGAGCREKAGLGGWYQLWLLEQELTICPKMDEAPVALGRSQRPLIQSNMIPISSCLLSPVSKKPNTAGMDSVWLIQVWGSSYSFLFRKLPPPTPLLLSRGSLRAHFTPGALNSGGG